MSGVEEWKKAIAAYKRKERTRRAMGFRTSKNPYKKAVGVRKARRQSQETERIYAVNYVQVRCARCEAVWTDHADFLPLGVQPPPPPSCTCQDSGEWEVQQSDGTWL